MIKASNFSRSYGTVRAVDGISFELGRGTIAERNPRLAKTMTGYLPENNPLYEEMEVADYLLYNGAVRGLRAEKLNKAVKTAVDRCGIGDVIGKTIGELSKGYRQRTGLANAVLHDPAVLFLDEPTSGLDPNQAEGVRALIRELGSEKTILFSTHLLEEARRICDELLIISHGRLTAQGKTADVLKSGEGLTILLLAHGADEAAVTARLKAIQGVTSCGAAHSADGAAFSLTAPQRDIRRDIYAAAVENHWQVLEIKKETSSLEDIFRSLTA